MKIRDLMTHSVSCVRPETSLAQVARQMQRENVGSIPVCDDLSQILGIVTDRDIVIRSVSKGGSPNTAGDVMTRNIISISPNGSTHEAALLMAKHQIRRLPVVEAGRLVGVLSLSDIARRNLYVDEAGDALSAISRAAPLN
ncbi:MAG: CBS domain-containing protein [Anaerovoracaceae bacterium]|jgi:CBS domain-containing protein